MRSLRKPDAGICAVKRYDQALTINDVAGMSNSVLVRDGNIPAGYAIDDENSTSRRCASITYVPY